MSDVDFFQDINTEGFTEPARPGESFVVTGPEGILTVWNGVEGPRFEQELSEVLDQVPGVSLQKVKNYAIDRGIANQYDGAGTSSSGSDIWNSLFQMGDFDIASGIELLGITDQINGLGGYGSGGGPDFSGQVEAINRAVFDRDRSNALRDTLAELDNRISQVGFDAEAAAIRASYETQKAAISNQRIYDQMGFAKQNLDLAGRKLESDLEFGLDSVDRTEGRIESNFGFAQENFDLQNRALLENEAFVGDDSDLANRSLNSRLGFLDQGKALSDEQLQVQGEQLQANAGLQQAGLDLSETSVNRSASLQGDPFRRFTSTVSGDAYQSKVRKYAESVRKSKVADQVSQLDLARRNIEEQLAQAQSALDFQGRQQNLSYEDSLANAGFQREQLELTLQKQLAEIERQKEQLIQAEQKAEVDRILDLEETAARAEELKENSKFSKQGFQLTYDESVSLAQAGLLTNDANLNYQNLIALNAERERKNDLNFLQAAKYNQLTNFGQDTNVLNQLRAFADAGGTNLYDFDLDTGSAIPRVDSSPLDAEASRVVSNLPAKPKAGYGADGIWRDPNARTTNVTPTFMNASGVINNLPTMQNAEYATPNPVARPEGV